jgi:rhodanese-related sulfurtransferase
MRKSVLSAFAPWLLSAILFLFVMGLLDLNIAYALPYTNTDVDTAYNMITCGCYPDLVVLDVRRQDEFNSGHIRGAVLIPHTELDGRIEELAGHENHEIIVYCRTGVRSVIASEILDSHNFTKVYNMLGGIQAWQSAGYPVWIPEEDVFWMQLWFWAIVGAAVIVALTGAVYFLKKRKPPHAQNKSTIRQICARSRVFSKLRSFHYF